jgi:site-specific recombinase XerD
VQLDELQPYLVFVEIRRGMSLLRHSAATRMLGQGAPLDTISDVQGHASVETTRIYAQVDLQGLRSVALSAKEVCL